MKTVFTLLLATVFTSAFAYDEARLTITVATPRNLEVYIDGRVYRDGDNTITLNNIQPGNHTIRIYRQGRSNGNVRNSRNDRNDRRNELLYSSNIYVRPSYHVDVMINRFGKALVDERVLSDRNDRWEDEGYGNGGYNNTYRQPMSPSDFEQLQLKIRSHFFGSARMDAAREGLQRNYFTSAQVRQVLVLFSTESDKLELARLAYRNTVDPRNYHTLLDVFSYRSSREELERLMREGQ